MKKLSKYQKLILLTGFILFLFINLFPPWIAWPNPSADAKSVSIGYGLLISPPQSPMGYESYVVINFGRLFLQWAGLAVLVGVSMFLSRKKIIQKSSEGRKTKDEGRNT